MSPQPSVRAAAFESRQVYRSHLHPGYTSWVSFFPGERGQWYLTCEEVTRPEKPLPQCTPQQWYSMGLPAGYDKSQYLMEAVILESTDDMRTWKVISRQPFRHHHTVGQFGTTRTPDGRFLRFAWSCYSLDDSVTPSEILYVSADDGRTWKLMPPFHDPHFVSYPHRLRTLRDGTLVLCVPLRRKWATEMCPVRTCRDLEVDSDKQMALFFSFDQGHTWSTPLPIYGGQNVSETDFVELPSGDLLFVNNSIFAHPGRQIVYRQNRTFTPGPLEKAGGQTGIGEENMVPETICLAGENILIGCLRAGRYQWSDDLGRTWYPLQGIPDIGPEVYQPWIHALPDGRIACAGHYGRDAPISGDDRDDQYLSIHFFELEVRSRTRNTRLLVERDFDPPNRRWLNAYTLTLHCDGSPLPAAEVEFWYVERDQPGYDSFGKHPLEERMEAGGNRLKLCTNSDGKAHVDLPHLNAVENEHHSIQFVARFNADHPDPAHKPCQTCQFEFYSVSFQDPPLEEQSS